MKKLSLMLLMSFFFIQCSNDETPMEEPNEDDEEEEVFVCEKTAYEETNGLVKVDFESIEDTRGWVSESVSDGYEGEGYIVWKGVQKFNQQSFNKITYPIKINNPGKYRFLWRSRILKGTDNIEHNDTWLSFPDASDFYGQKSQNGVVVSLVYPRGSLHTIPSGASYPNGASGNGWFKVYLSKTDRFDYAATTCDNDGHAIFVEFDEAGLYNMEISIRSSFHALDRFVLFKQDIVNRNTAVDVNTGVS